MRAASPRRLPALLAVPLLAGLLAAPLASAKIMRNTIDPVALVTGEGLHLFVTGPFVCTAGERMHLRLTVTQRATGALAEGRTLALCTGADQQWELHASAQGKRAFAEGPAIAVAVARTFDRRGATDAHQWLVEVTLVGE
jgi:hypothetical protein